MSSLEDETVLIAQRIKWWRLERKLSQQVVADRAGIDRSYLTKIESGAARLDSRSTIEKLARALGVSYADLTGQPVRPDTPELQEAHAAIERIRIAHVSLFPDDSGSIDPRGLDVIDAEVQESARAWQDCNYAAASRNIGRVLRELHSHTVSGNDRKRAWSLMTQVLDTASWTSRVLGYYDLAFALANRETDAARESEDPALEGLASFTRTLMIGANSSGDDDARGVAHRMAVRAIDSLRPKAKSGDRLEVLGMLHLAAIRSDVTSGGGTDLLTEASRLADRTGNGQAFHLYFGPSNVAIWQVHFAVERHEGGRVPEIAQSVKLEAVPSKARRQMFYRHVGLGLAQVKGKEEQAVRFLLRAESLAPGKLRIDPLARETVGHLLSRARANAGGRDLIRLARQVGLL